MSAKGEIVIECDECGNNLTHSANCLDYRLALDNERVPSVGGFVTSMMAYPALDDGAKHFCGIDCCRDWLNKVYPKKKGPYHGGKCWAEYQRKERAKARTETANGTAK